MKRCNSIVFLGGIIDFSFFLDEIRDCIEPGKVSLGFKLKTRLFLEVGESSSEGIVEKARPGQRL